MNLMFWKKKPADATEPQDSAHEKDTAHDSHGADQATEDAAGHEVHAKPSFAAKIKSVFAALLGKFKKPPEFRAGEDHAEERDTAKKDGASEPQPEDTSATQSTHPKKLLIIGGALLVILLLAGLGLIWKVITARQSQVQTAPVKTEDAHAIRPAPQTKIDHPPIGEHKKEGENPSAASNAPETPAAAQDHPQPDAQSATAAAPELPKEDSNKQHEVAQESAVPPAKTAAPAKKLSSELTFGNSDPKASAMTLKQAIEAMNAGSGGFDRKPSPQKPKAAPATPPEHSVPAQTATQKPAPTSP